jgi:hypothetical protein
MSLEKLSGLALNIGEMIRNLEALRGKPNIEQAELERVISDLNDQRGRLSNRGRSQGLQRDLRKVTARIEPRSRQGSRPKRPKHK